MSENLDERRVRFVYEAARLQAIAVDAPVVPEPWDERDEAFRAMMTPVVAMMCGPDRKSDAEELHDDWVKAYQAMGWTYGPVRDVETKTHDAAPRARPPRTRRWCGRGIADDIIDRRHT